MFYYTSKNKMVATPNVGFAKAKCGQSKVLYTIPVEALVKNRRDMNKCIAINKVVISNMLNLAC